ncbi:hypothetical protein ACUY3S_05380 [Corynebacterium resistens]
MGEVGVGNKEGMSGQLVLEEFSEIVVRAGSGNSCALELMEQEGER